MSGLNKRQAIRIISVTLGLCVAFSSCKWGSDQGKLPRETLSEYVTHTFAAKAPADKSKLLELTAGEVREALEKLDDQAFLHDFVENKKEFVSIKYREERKIDPDRYSITYELCYVSKKVTTEPGEVASGVDRVTNKKLAILEQKNGKWLITEVKNIKTFIEHETDFQP